MKKYLLDLFFGVTTGVVLCIVTPYGLFDWRYWAAFAPILITGVLASSKR